jgi:hypothetical protein
MNLKSLTPQQQINFKKIELRILIQQAIESIDWINDVEKKNNIKEKNLSLKSQLKAIYPVLDKESKKYNEIFNATEEGTTVFYEIVSRNVELVMMHNLIDKNFILCCFEAKQKNDKALMGIINKILKD